MKSLLVPCIRSTNCSIVRVTVMRCILLCDRILAFSPFLLGYMGCGLK